jgi:acyl-CoA synthetase (AMP-forming)/AMP-acid ligase II
MYLTQGLRRAQQIRPKATSTVFRGRRRTWSETAERVARFAGGLKAAGVRPGDRVAILALNSDRYFELMYAIPWLGAAMVPVNTRLAPPEIQYILEDSGARALFVDGATKAHATALAGKMPTVEAVFYLDDGMPPEGMASGEDLVTAAVLNDAGAGGDTLAGLFYTGGTTGKSKGVMLSHNKPGVETSTIVASGSPTTSVRARSNSATPRCRSPASARFSSANCASLSGRATRDGSIETRFTGTCRTTKRCAPRQRRFA